MSLPTPAPSAPRTVIGHLVPGRSDLELFVTLTVGPEVRVTFRDPRVP